MSKVQKTIDLDVPVGVAFSHWEHFENFPRFMEGVREVQRLGERRLRWRSEIAGVEEVWEAEITELEPNRRIAWRSTAGPDNAGTVTFESTGAHNTRVRVEMAYAPHGILEHVGDALGIVGRKVEGDLERFKQYVESDAGSTTP